jgi:hypothetical protein
MPFASTRAKLNLIDEDRQLLDRLSQSRSESLARVQRVHILQRYFRGIRAALQDLPGRGRPVSMTDEDKAWVVSLACQKPKDLGYAQELWTTRLAKHTGMSKAEIARVQIGRTSVRRILG